jgi:hypothetical protein
MKRQKSLKHRATIIIYFHEEPFDIIKLDASSRKAGQDSGKTWILHESEVFICKALKAEAIVHYASALITQQMEASGSPEG